MSKEFPFSISFGTRPAPLRLHTTLMVVRTVDNTAKALDSYTKELPAGQRFGPKPPGINLEAGAFLPPCGKPSRYCTTSVIGMVCENEPEVATMFTV